MPDALLRVADYVIAAGIDGPGPYRAARDLLQAPPAVDGIPDGGSLRRPERAPARCRRVARAALDETTLPIQGPPGTGKTYTGARMIARLLAAGRRVGITAQSHKAISNILQEVCRGHDRGSGPAAGDPEMRDR